MERPSDSESRVYPIIMYPYRHEEGTKKNLVALFEWLRNLAGREKMYADPITVVNRQTYYRNAKHKSFIQTYEYLQDRSEIVDAWSVDTCQMWMAGFGHAYDKGRDCSGNGRGHTSNVFWLIPGDFDYDSNSGEKVLSKYSKIPNIVYENQADICIGELQSDPDSSKQLIDTYGTYGLMCNWFPDEATELRKMQIRKPRSEFFAINQRFLEIAMIENRWFAYEQTVVLLLQAMRGGFKNREISQVELGDIEDPTGSRDTPASALQQIERTERVLKNYWREMNAKPNDRTWIGKFRDLSQQSAQIVGSAMIVLENSLERSK
ncbi:MAG: hypothetical protein AAF495_05485 [Pseudomonadota bacterium]